MPVRLKALETAFVTHLLRSPTLDAEASYLAACTTLGRKPALKPHRAGAGLYAKPQVQAELRRRLAYIEQGSEAQGVQIEQMLARHALSDIRQLFDAEGRMISPEQLGDDLAAAIVGIEEEDYVRGKGENQESGVRRKVKLADKQGAAKLLMQRRGMVRDQTQPGFVARIEINL